MKLDLQGIATGAAAAVLGAFLWEKFVRPVVFPTTTTEGA